MPNTVDDKPSLFDIVCILLFFLTWYILYCVTLRLDKAGVPPLKRQGATMTQDRDAALAALLDTDANIAVETTTCDICGGPCAPAPLGQFAELCLLCNWGPI